MLLIFATSTTKAQMCDFTDLFHYGRIDSPKCVFICEGSTKQSVWMNNIVDFFKFDSKGNLVSYNDEKYTNIVRSANGNIQECTRGNRRIKILNVDDRIDILHYNAQTDEFKGVDEYILNKNGFPQKRIRRYPSGRKSIRTYKYVEYGDNNIWYIRKVKDSDRWGKTSWYECRKTI